MVTRLVSIVMAAMALALCGLAQGQPAPATRPADPRHVGEWSKPLDELTVRIVAGRAVYHSGEQVQVLAEARNVGKGSFYVRTNGDLHLLTPSGEHLVHTLSASNRAHLGPGSRVAQGEWRLRLVKDGRHWRPAGAAEGKETPLDLTRVGTYTFWHEHEAAQGWLATMEPQAAAKGEPAWTGAIASPRLQIEVRELREADKVRELTAAQREHLRLVAEGVDKHPRLDVDEANRRLAEDLLIARNTRLADEATALVVAQMTKRMDDPPAAIGSLHGALTYRAVDRRLGRHWPMAELAIRGDYLRPVAELELKYLKAWFDVPPPQPEAAATRPTRARSSLSIEVLVALCLDSKDEPLRKPLAELAVANARLPNPLPWGRGADGIRGQNIAPINYHHGRLATAWELLRALDVLVGKTEAQVIAILGEPTKRTPTMLEWYASSPMHVNPFIRVELDGGKVQRVSSDVY